LTVTHRDDQDVAVAAELDVLEKPGAVEFADGRARVRGGQLVAPAERQVVVHRAFRNPLQALDADVRNDEGLGALSRGGPHHAAQNQGENSSHWFRSVAVFRSGLFSAGWLPLAG
jgi:hypothetical protein